MISPADVSNYIRIAMMRAISVSEKEDMFVFVNVEVEDTQIAAFNLYPAAQNMPFESVDHDGQVFATYSSYDDAMAEITKRHVVKITGYRESGPSFYERSI